MASSAGTFSHFGCLSLKGFIDGIENPARRTAACVAWKNCINLFQDSEVRLQFLYNVEQETRLRQVAWDAVFRVLVRPTTDAETRCQELTAVFRSLLLSGPVLPQPLPTRLGHAVTPEIFRVRLTEQFDVDLRCQAVQIIADLRNATPAKARRTLKGKLLMAPGRIMWATFSRSRAGSQEDPLGALTLQADTIRAALGLSPNEKGEDLFLFVYELPPAISPHYPTIADAYAGSDWPFYFRPALATRPSGDTLPWYGSKMASRPETVHMPVNACFLRRTICVLGDKGHGKTTTA
jgi:hypothetical protein